MGRSATCSQVLRDFSLKVKDRTSLVIRTSTQLLNFGRNRLLDELESLLLLQVVNRVFLLYVRLQADQVLRLFKFRGEVGLLLPEPVNLSL